MYIKNFIIVIFLLLVTNIFSKDQKTAEIGYDLHPQFHKKGIMTEALSCILNYGFKNLELENIEAYTHKENKASKSVVLPTKNFNDYFFSQFEALSNSDVSPNSPKRKLELSLPSALDGIPTVLFLHIDVVCLPVRQLSTGDQNEMMCI